jgi:hypothetical protein
MSIRNQPGGKGWLVGKADNLTTICELTVEPQHFTILWTTTACSWDSPPPPPLKFVHGKVHQIFGSHCVRRKFDFKLGFLLTLSHFSWYNLHQFWLSSLAPCRLECECYHFGGMYGLHVQDDQITWCHNVEVHSVNLHRQCLLASIETEAIFIVGGIRWFLRA